MLGPTIDVVEFQLGDCDEGRVVGIHHNSGVRNGKHLDVDCCIVLELENGRITSGREHFYNLPAWEQFWS